MALSTKVAIGIAVYLALGLLMLGNVGTPYARFQWCEPPSLYDRIKLVLLWPFLIVGALL